MTPKGRNDQKTKKKMGIGDLKGQEAGQIEGNYAAAIRNILQSKKCLREEEKTVVV